MKTYVNLNMADIPVHALGIVNAKGLQNPEGMGQGYVRVRVRVQNSEPSTNPYPYGRVEGFPGVGETE